MTSTPTLAHTVDNVPRLLQQTVRVSPSDHSKTALIWHRYEATKYFPLVAACKIELSDLSPEIQRAMREIRLELDPIAEIMCQAIIIVRSHQTREEIYGRRRAIDDARSRRDGADALC